MDNERRGGRALADVDLEVPFALASDGAEVRPEDATRGATYTCPDCRQPVILRAGPIVRTHFAHKASGVPCDFWFETEAHLRAKQRIAKAVEAHEEVRFVRCCRTCSFEYEQPLPADIARASLEHLLPGGLRADVALLGADGTVRAVLEVFATHECELEKIEALAGMPWAEFSASEILGDGLVWRPRADHFRPFTCMRCRATRARPFVGPGRLRIECPLPGAGEVLAVETCGQCRHFAGFDHATLLCAGAS